MSLLNQMEDQFLPRSKMRGVPYSAQDRVRILMDTPRLVRATVTGREMYHTRLIIDDSGRPGGECSCPAFAAHGPCKHLWALILEITVKNLQMAQSLAPLAKHPKVEEIRRAASDPLAEWNSFLNVVSAEAIRPGRRVASPIRLGFAIHVEDSEPDSPILLEILAFKPRKDGQLSQLGSFKLERDDVENLEDPGDRKILHQLLGADVVDRQFIGRFSDARYVPSNFLVEPEFLEIIAEHITSQSRCFYRLDDAPLAGPIRFDSGPPFELELRLDPRDTDSTTLSGHLVRGAEEMSISSARGFAKGFVFFEDWFARCDSRGGEHWLSMLSATEPPVIPTSDIKAILPGILSIPGTPRLQVPGVQFRMQEIPKPRIALRTDTVDSGIERLRGELSFAYRDTPVSIKDKSSWIPVDDGTVYLARNLQQEDAFLDALAGLGAHFDLPSDSAAFGLPSKRLAGFASEALERGMEVSLDGMKHRRAGEFTPSIRTGIDWFELEGGLDFDGQVATLPDLLTALRAKSSIVKLKDGSLGIVPNDLMRTLQNAAAFGTADGDVLRFRKHQGLLLDLLLAEERNTIRDEEFQKQRDKLKNFERIPAQKSPKHFEGELRPYQKDGLAWLHFLAEMSFGGCLADDMGLGKTIQVLALLQSMKEQKKSNGPALVVAPRSLIFNWAREAARFTPKLKVLDLSTNERKAKYAELDSCDLALTTYGCLRLDIATLKDQRFHYAILDEAQAIKTASSQIAKAARLLNAEHRLALSGTPIENHLGELWSLFDFINPGLLGKSAAFQSLAGRITKAGGDQVSLDFLGKALRPYILRRTKTEVLKDLPAKVEQVLWCDLEPQQRKAYDELAQHYRAVLLGKVDEESLGSMSFQVLEALLRLRQAAAHSGLLDQARREQTAAKFEALLPKLMELKAEGHKALVFSSFTSLLDLLEPHLKEANLGFQRLDGTTTDREKRVEAFNTDPESTVFLLSLKAGGLGLNLTMASYVFILDPWWNPAAEAQAVDRAHRIGQKQVVHTFRLICKNTVEERVLELQEKKRSLADALITADNSLMKTLRKSDLTLLLN